MSARRDNNVLDFGLSGLRGRMIAVLIAIVATSTLVLGMAVLLAFDRAVEPEIENRTRLIGNVVRGEVQHALEIGIPIGAIGGLDRYLSDILAKFEEVEKISLISSSGEIVAQVARPKTDRVEPILDIGAVVELREQSFQLPILERNRLVGSIQVEINPRFIQTQLRNVFLDIGMLALVAILIAVELSLAVVINSVGKPMDRMLRLLREQKDGIFLHQVRQGGIGGLSKMSARLNDHVSDLTSRAAALPENVRRKIDARISAQSPLRLRLSNFNDIRLALFLFALGTEISSAFMPLFAKTTSRPEWLSADIAAAMPLIFYLVAIAAVSPFGSFLTRKFGARNLFLSAGPGAAVALTGLAFSSSILQVTFFEGMTAFFYALAAIAGQDYAVKAADEKDRAKAVGAFVTVAYGGLFAGSALGGLIAGRFGFEAAFIAGAALTALSVFLGLKFMHGRAGDKSLPFDPTPDILQSRESRFNWITGRYAALLLCVAVPMNITMVIFVWYLTPLMLFDLGSGPAEIARVLVLYNVSFFLIGPTVARLADGTSGPMVLLSIGAVVSGASLLSLTVWTGFWAIALAVAGVGIGQVLMQTPTYAMALRINGGMGPGIDALRLIERVGAIVGLAAGAAFLGRIGSNTTLQILGVMALSGILTYIVVEARVRAATKRQSKRHV